eukprot:177729_1
MGNTTNTATDSEQPIQPILQHQIVKQPIQPILQHQIVNFVVGQKVQGKDGGWHDAIIKEVGIEPLSGKRFVKVRWLLDTWSSEQWDKIWTEDEWGSKIRDAKTKLPFSHVYAYEYKHIDEWTVSELREWIWSVNLATETENQIIATITEQVICGTDLNSMSNAADILHSFEIKSNSADKIFNKLKEVRAKYRNDAHKPAEKLKAEIDASVNTRWIGNWDVDDMLRWIKVYQDREEFEGKGKTQFNAMNTIIKKKRLSGKQLEICSTKTSLMKLFENKITSVTATVLLNSLNMERQMYHQREISKTIIKNNGWVPKPHERIRLVETRYTPPYRSYQSTIKKIDSTRIFVCYDGYSGSQGIWVKKKEWAERVTILKNTPIKRKSISNKQVKVRGNDVNQNDDPSEKVVFEVGQKIQGKDGDWYDAIIKEIGIDIHSGKRFVKVGWLLEKWSSERWDKIWTEDEWGKKIRDRDTHLPYKAIQYAYSYKRIDEWTCPELREWICSLTFKNVNEKKIITAITKKRMTGSDFNSFSSVFDIRNTFALKPITGKKLWNALRQIQARDALAMKEQMENDNNKLKHEIDSSHKEYSLLQEKFNDLSEKHSNLKKTNGNKEKRNTLEEQNRKLCQTKNDLIAVNKSLHKQIIDEGMKYSSLQKKYNKAERENASLKQNIEEKERNCDTLRNDNNKLMDEIVALKSKNINIVKMNNELTEANSDALLQQKGVDQETKYSLLLQKYSDLKAENASTIERNNDLNEECKELKIELKDIKDKYNKWVMQNSDYTTWDSDTITDWIVDLDEQ